MTPSHKDILFYVVSVLLIIILLILIILPFNANNLKQAQRIAVWKSEFEQIKYCFSLVDLYEHSIIPKKENASEEDELNLLMPYFNMDKNDYLLKKRYKYRKKNGRFARKDSLFYFNKFYKLKDGKLISLKKNTNSNINDNKPHFFMFIDINGRRKPNRIGQDIFFISIFKDHIDALGHDRPHVALKTNCSPLGSGVYCSEYYLLGGRF